MKKVVLVNQSTGYLMIDIVNVYASKYDQVALIAGSIKQNERKLDKDVKTDKIVEYNRTSGIKRVLTWIWGTFQIFFKLLFKYRGWHVVYVTNPPMSYLLALLLNNRFSVIVYDIYPDALANIGIKPSNFFFRKWVDWNKKLFEKAERVVTLSEGMKKQLHNYGSEDKIVAISNWTASSKLQPIDKRENPFVKEHNLSNKFVVLYSGNIGKTHNIEYIIETAKALHKHEDIHFMIIGEGSKKKILEGKVSEYNLNNCTFLTWQNTDKLPYSLASADVAVITLNDETSSLSVPSKTYNLFAVGAPLLCIASEKTELYQLVSKYNNGKCFDKNNIQGMVDYIIELHNNAEFKTELSYNSFKASTHFTYKNAEKYV